MTNYIVNSLFQKANFYGVITSISIINELSIKISVNNCDHN